MVNVVVVGMVVESEVDDPTKALGLELVWGWSKDACALAVALPRSRLVDFPIRSQKYASTLCCTLGLVK